MRERLIELLEEAQEKAKGTVGSMNGGFGAWYADYLIENGVVILIRCKDCKYYIQGTCTHPYIRHFVDENDYCSNGEKYD